MQSSTRQARQRLTLAAFAIAAISGSPLLRAATLTATRSTDSASEGLAGTGVGAAGELRAQMRAAGPGDTIDFSCGSPCTITLNGPLPPINSDLTIDGGTLGDVIIDGNNLYRVFFVNTGQVLLANLQIQNALAQGGSGGSGDGGGGGGLAFDGGNSTANAGARPPIRSIWCFTALACGARRAALRPR